MAKSSNPLTSLLIKPAGPDCNLACDYCFYLPKATLFPGKARHRMNDAVLEELMRQALEQCNQRITFSWQGGEPSLMGLDFYEKAISWQKKYGQGKAVSNALQTNGTLLDRKWAELFKEYNFLIGLSIDGPRHIHDRYRKFSGGHGSWQKVVNTAELLVQQGVAVNALTCLTDYSAQYPEEIYKFHKDVGLVFMQFIPVVEKSDKAGCGLAEFSVSPKNYADFMCKVFDLWLSDIKGGRPTTSIRLFESLFSRCLGERAAQCTFDQQCGSYLVVEHNGDVYPCDFYVDTPRKLGNVANDKLIDLLNSEKQVHFGAAKKELPRKCTQCHFLTFCQGGCPKDRVFNLPTDGASYFCESYKRIFAHALPVLSRLSRSWQPDNG